MQLTSSYSHLAGVALLDAGGTECANWQFPEYAYRGNDTAMRLAAKAQLVIADPAVADFPKTDAEIRRTGGATG